MSKYVPKVVVFAIAMLVVMVGIAYASIPGPDGVIHGCYKTGNPATGAVIVIDSEETCPSGFTALNWNQTGPEGPAGPAGGVSNVHVVRVDTTLPAAAWPSRLPVEFTAPEGEIILDAEGTSYIGGEPVNAETPTLVDRALTHVEHSVRVVDCCGVIPSDLTTTVTMFYTLATVPASG